MSDWCILRTKGSSTLRLARSLNDAGIEAWTPSEVQIRRHGRKRERSETVVAAMATYVFVRARALPTLVDIEAGPSSQHADFSLFRFNGKFGLVDDREVFRMRQIERRAAAKAEPPVFTKGQSVPIPDGPFQGLTGQVVETSKGEYTLIAFPGFAIPVKFATWTLAVAA